MFLVQKQSPDDDIVASYMIFFAKSKNTHDTKASLTGGSGLINYRQGH